MSVLTSSAGYPARTRKSLMWVTAPGTDVFDATFWRKNFESDSIKDMPAAWKTKAAYSSGVLSGAISLQALRTWPVENKTFYLIKLFPLENVINYKRKKLYCNLYSRRPTLLVFIMVSKSWTMFLSDSRLLHLLYINRLIFAFLNRCLHLSRSADIFSAKITGNFAWTVVNNNVSSVNFPLPLPALSTHIQWVAPLIWHLALPALPNFQLKAGPGPVIIIHVLILAPCNPQKPLYFMDPLDEARPLCCT